MVTFYDDVDDLPEEGVAAAADSITHYEGETIPSAASSFVSWERDVYNIPTALSYAFILSSFALYHSHMPFGLPVSDKAVLPVGFYTSLPQAGPSSSSSSTLRLFRQSDPSALTRFKATLGEDQLKFGLNEDHWLAPGAEEYGLAPDAEEYRLAPGAEEYGLAPGAEDDPWLAYLLADGFTLVTQRRFGMERGKYWEGPYLAPQDQVLENAVPWLPKPGHLRKKKLWAKARKGGYVGTSDGPAYLTHGTYGASNNIEY